MDTKCKGKSNQRECTRKFRNAEKGFFDRSDEGLEDLSSISEKEKGGQENSG